MPDAAEGIGKGLPETPDEPAQGLKHRHLVFIARGAAVKWVGKGCQKERDACSCHVHWLFVKEVEKE
jgi:hypothetical protein